MDPKYNTICSHWVQSIVNMSCFINAFPLPLKPSVSVSVCCRAHPWYYRLAIRLYNPCSKALKDAIAYLTPIIDIRNEELKHAPYENSGVCLFWFLTSSDTDFSQGWFLGHAFERRSRDRPGSFSSYSEVSISYLCCSTYHFQRMSQRFRCIHCIS